MNKQQRHVERRMATNRKSRRRRMWLCNHTMNLLRSIQQQYEEFGNFGGYLVEDMIQGERAFKMEGTGKARKYTLEYR